MKKSLITLSITLVVLVIVYLAYSLLKPMLSPCESIFQQTSLRLGSKLDIIKTKGEVFIGEEKIQDLTERSQMTALNLKTCCIVLEGGKVSSDEFLRCKENVEKYETQIEKIATDINEAQTAKQQGNTEVVNEKVNQINETINIAQASAENLSKQVTGLKGTLPVEKTENRDFSQGGNEEEPNNTAFEANSVPMDSTVSGEISSQDDKDYFKFQNNSNLRDLVKVNFLNKSTTLAPDIFVYDQNKAQLLEQFDGTPGADLEFSFPAEPGKDYYLNVPYYSGSGKYDLSVKLQKAYDKYEPNDDASSAKTVDIGEPISANILDEEDVDWYKLHITTGEKINLRLENKSTTLAPWTSVYDQNKAQILEQYNGTPGADLEFAFDAEPGKSYYLKIPHYLGSGEYKILLDQG